MQPMPSAIPTPAFVLGLLILPSAMILGSAIGSWPVPLVLATLRDGQPGIHDIPTEWGLFANISIWLNGQNSRLAYLAAVLVDGAFMLAGLIVVGLLGGRLWGWLVVKKFKWMTQEEVREFSKRDPGI